MQLTQTFFAFLFAIALLVTIHELGHYWVARRCGVRVLAFSIGFGKPLLQWQRGETQWQIAAIPLGGFVRMLGESDEQPLTEEDKRYAYNHQPPLRKMAIVLAGPLANLLLAWLLYALAWMVGVDALKPVIASVRVGSVAEQAGFRAGDEVLRLGGMNILDWDDLRLATLAQTGENLAVQVHSAEGAERELQLDLSRPDAAVVDAAILSVLGLSPVPLYNRIAQVEKDSVADRAGLRAGDAIVAINDLPVKSWERLQAILAGSPGKALRLAVQRDNEVLNVELTPESVKAGQGEIGRIGIAPVVDEAGYEAQKFTLRLNPLAALLKSAEKSWTLSKMTLQMIGRMFTGGLSSRNVSGPIGIASLAGKSASLGLSAYLQFLALVSLSLGVLNLLPIPVLDGGHLLYHSAELVRGRPLPPSWLAIGQRIGLALLLGLMLLAFYNDITQFFIR